jgi:hypothetical protein
MSIAHYAPGGKNVLLIFYAPGGKNVVLNLLAPGGINYKHATPLGSIF